MIKGFTKKFTLTIEVFEEEEVTEGIIENAIESVLYEYDCTYTIDIDSEVFSRV